MSFDAAELKTWAAAAARQLPDAVLMRTIAAMKPAARQSWWEAWPAWTHEGQDEPTAEEKRVWLMMAGRGFGKTRAGAEWLWARIRETPGARVALIGPTIDEAVRVMVKGQSGLIATARGDEAVRWHASSRELALPGGGLATVYSGAKPDGLRGPEHHFAWCDEIAAWRHAEATWDNLMLGLRLGGGARGVRVIVTTTPRPGGILARLTCDRQVTVTRGRTADNPHLPADFRAAMARAYANTRLGRQELDGELLEDIEGALWTRAMLEHARVAGAPPSGCAGHLPVPGRMRVVVGVDPPAAEHGTCGIVVCALQGSVEDGVALVLDDRSVRGLSPAGWARVVAAAAEDWGADRVIAEANNGGAMVEQVLRGASVTLPVKPVHASRGKAARAEPVAALFEQGRVKLAGHFPALEDQLCGFTPGGWEGAGSSPDRADACVWALTELMLGRRSAAPRVTVI